MACEASYCCCHAAVVLRLSEGLNAGLDAEAAEVLIRRQLVHPKIAVADPVTTLLVLAPITRSPQPVPRGSDIDVQLSQNLLNRRPARNAAFRRQYTADP
jgi:hypothetical protein